MLQTKTKHDDSLNSWIREKYDSCLHRDIRIAAIDSPVNTERVCLFDISMIAQALWMWGRTRAFAAILYYAFSIFSHAAFNLNIFPYMFLSISNPGSFSLLSRGYFSVLVSCLGIND